jgi:hypothetical protein
MFSVFSPIQNKDQKLIKKQDPIHHTDNKILLYCHTCVGTVNSSHSPVPCAISVPFWGRRPFCGVAGRYVHAESCGSSPACHTLSMRKVLDPHYGNHGYELWGWTCWQIREDIMDISCTSSADHWHSLQTGSLKQHRHICHYCS